jgi:hypothetical protein
MSMQQAEIARDRGHEVARIAACIAAFAATSGHAIARARYLPGGVQGAVA